jgi:ankyrin repeat protein
MALAQHVAHLTPEHVALLRKMQIIWIPVEAGGPYPSHDFTYGSSDVLGDAQRILTRLRGDGRKVATSEAQAYHDEALALLPTFIARGSLKPGRYAYRLVLPKEEQELTPWALKHRAGADSDQVQVDVGAEHITLLKHLRFESGSDMPINFKRPYGDMTSFELDMADLLGVTPDVESSAKGRKLSKAQLAHLEELHESLEGVLQVWVQNATIQLDDAPATEYRPRPDPMRFLTAVARRDLQAAEGMLRSGVDALARDAHKRSAVELALDNGDYPMLELLFAEKAVINTPQGRYKRTPLMMAAEKGDCEAIRLALKHGGDLSVADEYGRTALGHAFVDGRDEVIELILSTGRTEPASLGIVGYEPSELKRNPEQPPDGVPVKNVLMGSAADRAGLKKNDLLTAINGTPLSDFASLRALLGSRKAGDRMKLSVWRPAKTWREAQTFDVEVRLGPPMGGVLKYQSGPQVEAVVP